MGMDNAALHEPKIVVDMTFATILEYQKWHI